jgi:hypothetical protein
MQSHLLKNGKICGPLPLLWLLGNNKYFLNDRHKLVEGLNRKMPGVNPRRIGDRLI